MFSLFSKKRRARRALERGMQRGAEGDLKAAEKEFLRAAKLNPDEPNAHYQLAYTLSLQGRAVESVPHLKRTQELSRGFFLVETELYMAEMLLARQVGEDGYKAFRLISMLRDAGQQSSEETLSLVRQLIERYPRLPIGYFFLGKGLLGSDAQQAEENLRRCLELNPDDTTRIDAAMHLVMLMNNSGRQMEGRELAESLLRDHEGHPQLGLVRMIMASGPGTS